jgi:hypothetical protein
VSTGWPLLLTVGNFIVIMAQPTDRSTSKVIIFGRLDRPRVPSPDLSLKLYDLKLYERRR